MVSTSPTPQQPALDAGWQWHWVDGRPYLQCELLHPFAHGFFTRSFHPQSPTDLSAVLAPQARAYRTRQVHGNRVMTAAELDAAGAPGSEADGEPLEADGTLATQPQQAVWVATADCTPALIADAATGRAAAVHAGWRGTAQRILPEAIARLTATGSQLSDLRVALGPAIAGEFYQVSSPVAARVGASLLPSQPSDDPDAILSALQSLPDSPLLPDAQPGRARLDVARANRLQLEAMGLSPTQIAITPYCTYQQPAYFFSYRRCRAKKVQWSGIVSAVRADERIRTADQPITNRTLYR